MAVPIAWADPGGSTIDVAVVRDRADDAARKVGTLVLLPGGPGSSWVDEILRGKFSPELRARFDIISLDPRGVKRSHPVLCDGGLGANRPNMMPDAGGRIDEARSYARDLADSCRNRVTNSVSCTAPTCTAPMAISSPGPDAASCGMRTNRWDRSS
jgi:pimeloyl-ACP methyl ester carboxylesterase